MCLNEIKLSERQTLFPRVILYNAGQEEQAVNMEARNTRSTTLVREFESVFYQESSHKSDNNAICTW